MRRAGPTEQQCLSTCFVKPVSQSPEVEQYWCWIGDYTWSLCAMNIRGPAAIVFDPGQWPKKCSLEIVQVTAKVRIVKLVVL